MTHSDEMISGFHVSEDSEYWTALMTFFDLEIQEATLLAASSAPQHSSTAREFNAGRLNQTLKLKDDLERLRRKACEGEEKSP